MKKDIKRVFCIVLDSFGIGAAPDAHEFGDDGANTLESISSSPSFYIPNLIRAGLGSVDGVKCLPKCPPTATVGRLREKSRGKDTTVGHWELMGFESEYPLPTYKDGFPKSILDEFTRRTGRGVLCNLPYSGTKVINDYGREHLESGNLIVYTSADSVFQIAAHEELIQPEELYRYCRIAREILTGKYGVGRVIARPFVGKEGSFTRTDRRRDFSLKPTGTTTLDRINDVGLDVIGVGKISDIFAGCGITESHPTHGNREGIEKTLELMDRDFCGLAFINLVDFDMLYGHRQDRDGYASALSEFDKALGQIIPKLKATDRLIITADHGCDPCDDSTDHTREFVPLLVFGDEEKKNLGTIDGFSIVGDMIEEYLGVENGL